MNYRESNITGSTWVRCRAVTITNPHESQLVPPGPLTPGVSPTAYFQEEQVVTLPNNEAILRDIGACQKAFNPGATIPLLDPATGQPTGTTVTHGELYAILYSLYIQTATERDAGSAG